MDIQVANLVNNCQFITIILESSMTTRTFNVDLKALRLNLYPTDENTGATKEFVKTHVRNTYNAIRTATNVIAEQGRQTLHILGLHDLAAQNYPNNTAGDFDSEFTIDVEFETTMNVHDVQLINLKVTVTPVGADKADAFLILNRIDLEGTFAIEPTYRVTGY